MQDPAWKEQPDLPGELHDEKAQRMPAEYPLVAFRERPSLDPITGEEGILRDEWRVRPISCFTPEEIAEQWGPSWYSTRPGANQVLEHRYIRRGAEEPWRPFDRANTYEQALEYIVDDAIPLCDALKLHQDEVRLAREAAERKAKEERIRKAEEARQAQQKTASRDAFIRLRDSRVDGAWAGGWNLWIAEHRDDSKEEWLKDIEFMDAYQNVMGATTVPEKKRAIKNFLSVYGPDIARICTLECKAARRKE